jgi:hypothetical protein
VVAIETIAVGCCDVRLAVAVEVAADWISTARVEEIRRRCKSSVTISSQVRQRGVSRGYDDICFVLPVKVTDDRIPHRGREILEVKRGRAESPVAVSQEHAITPVLGRRIGGEYHQVKIAVAVEAPE